MRTPVIMISLIAAAGVPVLAESQLPESERPPATIKPLENDPHAAHYLCHSELWRAYSYCSSIRANERTAYTNDAASGTHVEVIDELGGRSTGRRNTYSASSITSKFTSEASYSATAWLTRYQPLSTKTTAGASAHPEFEGSATVNSCGEYAYKRYYQANRHLDAIGTLTAARRYPEAVKVILEGSPVAIGTAKPFAPATTNGFVDYDNRPITDYSDHFNGPAKWPLTPPRNSNPFFSISSEIIDALPGSGESWEQYLPAALAASSSRPYDSAKDTWAYAQTMRNNAEILALSAAERDDVAERITRMRHALGSARKQFERCTTANFAAATASTTQYPNGQTLEQYAMNITYDGVTDPVDWHELALQSQLIDDALSSSTLGNVLSASTYSKDLYGLFSKTATGSLLRRLGAVDLPALQAAIAGTKYSFKSGTWSACNSGFYEVARLLVEEYRRGNQGCMSSTSARCEFSMPIFARDVADQLAFTTKDIDLAKDRCLVYLGNDFDGTESPVAAAKRTSLTTFENHFKARKAELDTILRNTPTASELPDSIGDRRGGLTYWGDRTRFGAGYSYEAEWGVNIIEKAVDSRGNQYSCRLGGQVEAGLQAWVTLFGVDRNLINASLLARTVQTDASLSAAEKLSKFEADIDLLGIDVYDDPYTKLPTSFTETHEESFDVPVVRTTVLLGFIPVTISAGFGFDYGYLLSGKFTQSPCQPSPTLNLSGDVKPRAGANAYVEAYVDLFVVGAGVKGELTLIEAELPFVASVSIAADPSSGGAAVRATSSLGLQLTELSGDFSFIVKVVGITVWEAVLFSWPGIRQVIPLWSTDVTFPFAGFGLLP